MTRNRAAYWMTCGVLTLILASAPFLLAEDAQKAAKAPGKTPAKAQKGEAEVTLQILNWEESMAIVKQHKGKIVVMDVWSTSCEPCMKEFPNLVKLHQEHGKDVACVSVSTDFAGSKNKPPKYYQERVLKFLTQQEATFDNVLCNVPSDELFEKIELASIPAVYVYGRDGKLVKRFDSESAGKVGTDDEAFTYADVNKLVDSLLKKK
jgi:thiol-disulfide isomerase/thioredoxin